MAGSEKIFEQWTRLILLIAIAVTIVFLGIFAMLGLRIHSDLSCGIDTIGPNINAELDNHTNPLNHSTDYILQEFELNTTTLIKYQFCFSVHCMSTNGAQLEIINQDETLLNTEFAQQGQGRYCSSIENVSDNQFLGLRCPTCVNTSERCYVQEVIAGDTIILVEKDNTTISVSENEIMSYTLNSYKDCKDLTRWFLWAYLWTLLGLFFMILILVGFRRFEKFIFEEVKIE